MLEIYTLHAPNKRLQVIPFLEQIFQSKNEPLPLIERNAFGKPEFKDTPLSFNGSHSGDRIVCALCNQPIGIDLQQHIPNKNFVAIAKRFFSINAFHAIEHASSTDRTALFYRYWSQYEAIQKYTGRGFNLLFRDIQIFENDFDYTVEIEGKVYPKLHLRSIHIAPEYSCFICSENLEPINIFTL